MTNRVSLSARASKRLKTGIDWNQIDKFTPEMCYVLGLIWADGGVYRRSDISNGTVAIGVKPSDMRYFKPILDKVGRWSHRRTRKKKYGGNGYHYLSIASIYSVEFVDWLIEMGYVKKSFNSAEKILEAIPDNLRSYWILGLFDGDGSVGNLSMDAHISSGYSQDWGYIEKVLRKLDIKYHINRYKSAYRGGSDVVVTRTSVLKFFDLIYCGKLGLPRKRKDADRVISNIVARASERRRSKYIRQIVPNGSYHVYAPSIAKKMTVYVSTHKTKRAAVIARDAYCKAHGISIEEMFYKTQHRHPRHVHQIDRSYVMAK